MGVSGGGRVAARGSGSNLVLQMRKNFVEDGAIFDNRNDLHLSPAFWTKQGIYTLAINRNLIHQAYANTPFLTNVPDSDMEIAARHPDSFSCLGN